MVAPWPPFVHETAEKCPSQQVLIRCSPVLPSKKWIATLRKGDCIEEHELKSLCSYVKDILVRE